MRIVLRTLITIPEDLLRESDRPDQYRIYRYLPYSLYRSTVIRTVLLEYSYSYNSIPGYFCVLCSCAVEEDATTYGIQHANALKL